jgi:hypothetical protein
VPMCVALEHMLAYKKEGKHFHEKTRASGRDVRGRIHHAS